MAATPRLMSMLDRNPLSKTYGSFDRNFWLHRTSSFSSSAKQQGLLAMALLFDLNRKDNFFYRNQQILEYVVSALRFTLTLQKNDGSFDEWYFNERGWAGPTAYVMVAVLRARELLKSWLPVELLDQIEASALGSADFLFKYEEMDVLSNHQAIALLALAYTKPFAKDKNFDMNYLSLWGRFQDKFQKEEGWSLEYDGVDPGYQSATLSFIARLHRLTQAQTLVPILETQISFLNQCVFSNGFLGGCVGSRGTSNVFYFGFEYLSSIINDSEVLAKRVFEGLLSGINIKPSDQEDHYLPYRLPEFLECVYLIQANHREFSSISSLTNSRLGEDFFEQFKSSVMSDPARGSSLNETFVTILPLAGLFKYYTRDLEIMINFKKAGSFVYSKNDNENSVFQNHGWLLQLSNGEVLSSSFINKKSILDWDGSQLKCEGKFSTVKWPLLTFKKRILFDVLCSALVNGSLARWFKAGIRRLGMFSNQPKKGFGFSRIFDFGNRIVSDKVCIPSNVTIISGFVGGDFLGRLVPQSQYFSKESLSQVSTRLNSEQIKLLNSNLELTISESLCVE